MNHPERGWWIRLAALALRRPLSLVADREWQGAEHLPPTGGVIVCSNHISHFDPLTLAHFLYDNGRLPRFLAKASLFDAPLIGRVLRGAGQIPVYRDSADAVHAFSAAVDSVNSGHCIALYPEGTLTIDVDGWPMTAKSGAARIALSTGAPLIPVAQWGPEKILPSGAKVPRFFPRRTMHVVAGPPIDLSAYVGLELNAELLLAASEQIMAAITALLEKIRDELAPAVRTKRADQTRHLPNIRRPKSSKRRSA